VLVARIEVVGGQTPQVQQVGPAEVARRERASPVEDDRLQTHGPATYLPRLAVQPRPGAPPPSLAGRASPYAVPVGSLRRVAPPFAVAGALAGAAATTRGRATGPGGPDVSAPTRTVPVPASLVLVAERVESRLAELLDTEIERWRALDQD